MVQKKVEEALLELKNKIYQDMARYEDFKAHRKRPVRINGMMTQCHRCLEFIDEICPELKKWKPKKPPQIICSY